MRLEAVLLLATLFEGCNYHDAKGPRVSEPVRQVGTTVTYEEVREKILQPLCLECHNPKLARGGLDLSTEQAARVAIDPGNPRESLLYNMVEWDEMPPSRKIPPLRHLTAEEKSLVKAWIETGAR